MAPSTIRCRGRTYRVQEQLRLGGRTYYLLQNLASGFRERYQAYDPVARDFRSITVLPKTASPIQHLKNLQQLARHNGAAFPMVLEIQSRDDSYFVIQAWAWGHDLASKIRHAEKHPDRWPGPLESFQIYRRLAHGLAQLHQQTGLIHGDVTPANLVLVRSRIFIIDFGSAWTFERTAHRSPGDGLSGAYASPEQRRDEAFIDFRSDYFSASVIAYQLFTRQLPYDGLGGKAGLIEYGDTFANKFVPPSELSLHRGAMRPEFWTRIDRILTTGLSLHAANRFPNRDAWLSEIESLNAMLAFKPEPGWFSRKLLHCMDWATRWFGRRQSPLQ